MKRHKRSKAIVDITETGLNIGTGMLAALAVLAYIGAVDLVFKVL
jgi:hypothetical protein